MKGDPYHELMADSCQAKKEYVRRSARTEPRRLKPAATASRYLAERLVAAGFSLRHKSEAEFKSGALDAMAHGVRQRQEQTIVRHAICRGANDLEAVADHRPTGVRRSAW
jgi:hypothetical protein